MSTQRTLDVSGGVTNNTWEIERGGGEHSLAFGQRFLRACGFCGRDCIQGCRFCRGRSCRLHSSTSTNAG
eukprot:2467068-Pyramimonas_sp.AAC.1